MALVALCRGVVDYAGTFPPAKLALSEAIERYAQIVTPKGPLKAKAKTIESTK